MKFFARIILTVFVLFLTTPTIVTLIKKNTDTSVFYSFSEEEIHKELKQVKAEVKQAFDYPFLDLKIQKNTAIISENLSRHDNVTSEIFSPPPESI
ncbi:MAG: hypothetical protein QM710_03570 [Flavobacterium sp.]